MKTKILILAIMLSASNVALAQKTNNSQGATNGQPFQALDALIQENRDLIDANSGAIADLQLDVSALQVDISDVSLRMDDMQTQIDLNVAAIDSARTLIASNTAGLQSVRVDLRQLQLSVRRDILGLRRQIASLDAEVSLLIRRNTQRILSLRAQLLNLNSQVQNNTASINPLITDIALLQTDVAANTNSIAALTNQSNILSGMVAQLDADVNALAQEIDSLKGRVGTLEGYHPDLQIGASVTGALTTDDAISVAHPYRRTNAYADYYTFLVPETRTITISLGSNAERVYGGPGFFDTFLSVHTGECDNCRIAFNDDVNSSLNSQITVTLEPGIYTIEVSSYGDYAVGTYWLDLN